jgi:hypothetical protein
MAASMKLSLERNIQLGFAFALAIVIAAGGVTLRSAAATGDSARWVDRALGLRVRLSEIQLLFNDAEAGVRSYVADDPSQHHRADSLTAGVPAGMDQLAKAAAVLPGGKA